MAHPQPNARITNSAQRPKRISCYEATAEGEVGAYAYAARQSMAVVKFRS
jgi:hypothetical protein